MKKFIFFLLLLVIHVGANAQNRRINTPDSRLETTTGNSLAPVNKSSNIMFNNRGGAPDGTVPGLTSYWDYVTNGNNFNKLIVLGDTIIIAADLADSVNAAVSNARRTYYQVSIDGGNTWLSDPVAFLSGVGTAYPQLIPAVLDGSRTIVMTGRQFVGSTSRGTAIVDLVLGAGATSSVLNRNPGRDYFGVALADGKIGGANFSGGGTTDTLLFAKYNYTTNTFETPQVLALPEAVGENGRQYIAGSPNGQKVLVMRWASDKGMYVYESTNAGNSFGPEVSYAPGGFELSGDSVTTWFGADAVYRKDNSSYGIAFSTIGWEDGAGVVNLNTFYKMVYRSPSINGGAPVLIADRTNIPYLNDTALYNSTFLDVQQGMTPVAHASLGYSDDGSRLFCVYTVMQPDTSNYPKPNANYNFNDVYVSWSDNHGATWSSPKNLTNTADEDEIYPTISKTGNTTTSIKVTYSSSRFPGSASFTQAAYVGPVYQVYKIFSTVGINVVSNEVPKGFSLSQNYPNPFNPTTKIRFEVSKTEKISLKVYDIAGKEITTLVNNEVVAPGTKEVSFDASRLSSGIYFYTLQAGSFTETRKMMLVK